MEAAQYKKWDYLIFSWAPTGIGLSFQDELNEFGSEGWELVTIIEFKDGIRAYFKRPALPA